MADRQLDLFFKIVDMRGADFAVHESIKLIEAAISADTNLAKIADIGKAFRGLEKSQSIGNALILHSEICKWTPNVNLGLPAGLMALMALLGDLEGERFTAWRLMYTYQHDRDISPAERNRLLVESLGWMMQSVGGCHLTAMRLGAEDTLDLVDLLGYDFASRIKALPLDASSFEAIVDHEGRDAPIFQGQRYSTDGWRDEWNFVDEQSGLPGIVVGKPGCHLYSTGAETPLLALGAIAARVRARTGSSFETLCDQVIADPGDFSGGWELVEAMRFQTTLDLREEIEGVISGMAFAGDKQALLEAAATAVRRGYHHADKNQLVFALGALAVASGVRELTLTEPNENNVDVTVKMAGEYLLEGLMKQIKQEIASRTSDTFKKFQESEQAAAAERRQDEEVEREIARVSEQSPDDLIDDEIETTRSPLTKIQQRIACLTTPNTPETLRVVHSIGNADIARDDCKHALARIAELQKPMKLAPMPEDLSAWRQTLLQEFPHCGPAIDAIYGDLLTRQMNAKRGLMFKPTLFVGSPGSGKSRLARRIAETLKIGYRVMPCGGVADGHFAGVSRGWHSSHPSSPLDLIRQTNVPNPILVLDELEKSASSRHNGNLIDVLLSMLEPETSRAWQDPFVQGPVNISAVNWLATANSLAGLPSPLLDRFRIIHVDSPTIGHLPQLAATIIREISTQHGHADWHQPLDGVELSAVGRAWVRQPSIRYLRRLVEGALRAREMSAGKH